MTQFHTKVTRCHFLTNIRGSVKPELSLFYYPPFSSAQTIPLGTLPAGGSTVSFTWYPSPTGSVGFWKLIITHANLADQFHIGMAFE